MSEFQPRIFYFEPKMADFEAKLTDLSRKRTISNQNVGFNWKNEKIRVVFKWTCFPYWSPQYLISSKNGRIQSKTFDFKLKIDSFQWKMFFLSQKRKCFQKILKNKLKMRHVPRVQFKITKNLGIREFWRWEFGKTKPIIVSLLFRKLG